MVFRTGNIYIADLPRGKVNDIHGTRPVIVIKCIGDDKVEVVPLSTNTHVNAKNRVTMNLLLTDRVSYVTMLFDKILVIPTRCIKTQIGEVNEEVRQRLSKIALGQTEMLTEVEHEDQITSQDTESNKEWGAQIEPEYIHRIEKYIIGSNDILKQLISRKTMVINIITAIITGIVASLITNYIWTFFICPPAN